MARFIIQGGQRIAGNFRPLGNKNAVLPMLAACMLTDKPVRLHNVPMIQDVRVMLELLETLGVKVIRDGHSVEIDSSPLKTADLPADLCRRVRTSILLAGPLAMRTGRATLHPPGGDVIGRRRLDTHFYGLEKLGMRLKIGDGLYVFERGAMQGADLLLDEASVTATEHILMTAVLTPGTTTIFNAACEPHVQDLCRMLVKMGARIQGSGTNLLTVEGVEALNGTEHEVGIDHIELGSFAAAAALTGGTLHIEQAPDTLTRRVIQKGFSRLNLKFEEKPDGSLFLPETDLRVCKDMGGAIPKIEDGIWPAFPSDLMSIAIVLATQAQGMMLFFEKLFESRMYFVDHLLEMGANIVQCDPHRIVVNGPARLHGTLLTSPDIRAGMAMILAALCADGQSIIENAYMVDRGYEAIDDRLRALGADIIREND